MATAARMAWTASSACRTGAPKTAMMLSPMCLSMVPLVPVNDLGHGREIMMVQERGDVLGCLPRGTFS